MYLFCILKGEDDILVSHEDEEIFSCPAVHEEDVRYHVWDYRCAGGHGVVGA